MSFGKRVNPVVDINMRPIALAASAGRAPKPAQESHTPRSDYEATLRHLRLSAESRQGIAPPQPMMVPRGAFQALREAGIDTTGIQPYPEIPNGWYIDDIEIDGSRFA